MLHDFALDHIDLRRHGIEFDLQTRSRFIDKVDCFVWQKTIADVAMGQDCRRDQRRISDANTVMDFVAFLQSAQNRDRVFYARLIDEHRLKSSFECGVFLDVFAVFIERSRTDCAQLAPRQHRLEHVRRVDRAFGRARADNRVQLIDEKDDLALRIGDLFQKRF